MSAEGSSQSSMLSTTPEHVIKQQSDGLSLFSQTISQPLDQKSVLHKNHKPFHSSKENELLTVVNKDGIKEVLMVLNATGKTAPKNKTRLSDLHQGYYPEHYDWEMDDTIDDIEIYDIEHVLGQGADIMEYDYEAELVTGFFEMERLTINNTKTGTRFNHNHTLNQLHRMQGHIHGFLENCPFIYLFTFDILGHLVQLGFVCQKRGY